MKLEDKFFSAFFYPFFIGVALSIAIVITILFHYSKGFLDERTASEVYKVETNFANNNIYSVNILITNLLLKIQIAIQEQLSYFKLIEKNIDISSNLSDKKEIKDIYSVFEDPYSEKIQKRMKYASLWYVDPYTKNVNDNGILYYQIYIFSLVTQSMYSSINSMDGLISKIYFIFEDTNLFAVYPYKHYLDNNKIKSFLNYTNNPSWCTDTEGNIIQYYKFKCRSYYNDILKSKKTIFDYNAEDQKNRKIYVTSPYVFFGSSTPTASFSVCIEFNYTLSNTNAYVCADIEGHALFDTFDRINDNLLGYFTISSVGFNNEFYFPHIINLGTGKTISEYIFSLDVDYYLEEKIHFLTVVQKYMTSNYISFYNENMEESVGKESMNILNEVFIDNENEGENQYFYLDEEMYEYSIFPIILENYENEKEHVLSIIHIYKEADFHDYIFEFETDTYSQLALQLILFFMFGSILLYIISLSFKLLAKFIVIPIRNAHYMLEGINVGGEYRLEYLSNLKKKQEDNLEKLNKINREIIRKKKEIDDNIISELNDEKENNNNLKQNVVKFNDNNKEKKNFLEANEENKNKINLIGNRKSADPNIITPRNAKEDSSSISEINLIDNDDNINNLDYDGEIIDPNINYDRQYDLEGDKIEKELNFYDFDEELLQYRPVEIDRLVQSLLNLKSALMLTSSEQDIDQIIGYSNSESIFNNFKNREGSQMCQSNIGNMQSQLAKYDKAIYHLALSLQNIELKKFLSQSLNDEFDDGDILLHKIEMSYGKNSNEKELNILAKKQQKTGFNKKISQNAIEILINSRYNKLINFYFKFFSSIQKSKYNYEKLGGCFANTNFHTINNYHKVLIQYIYLCFISNDLVKIGESILDYVEFLIKFRLKTSKENEYILDINNKSLPEINKIQINKKKYFDKIINWLTLFDNYAKQIKENSALGNFKDVLNAYVHNLQSNHSDFDSENQSALLFQANLQRSDFLKGKFALACKNYTDALAFFINAAKKKRIVIDGLIKKRALKHIEKIAEKTRKNIISYNYSNFNYLEILEKIKNNSYEYKNLRSNQFNNKNMNLINEIESRKDSNKKAKKLIDKIKELIEQVKEDINETNEKQLKDIIILIDFNSAIKLTIDSYIDVVKTILKNYLTNNDRIGVFILENEYRVICPMASKKDIDIINFSKDLDNASELLFKKEKIENISLNHIIQENAQDEDLYSDKMSEESFTVGGLIGEKRFINEKGIPIEDMIKSLNYCLNYLKMKEISTNEKYFIFFTSSINSLMEDLNIDKQKELRGHKKKIKILIEPKINFLLVGKFDRVNEDLYNEILAKYFGSKSEIIPFDNMKKIKSILSSNNIINDNIQFPNEIYK